MIDTATFTNLNTDTITFNEIYPILLYDDPVVDRADERPKSYADGMWPVYPYREGMEITIEGAILADDAVDYTTKRQDLISVLRYVPVTRERKSGVLSVVFSGVSEAVEADVIIRSFSAPRDGKSPNYSEFRLVMQSFLPWYIGADSNNPYYDG